jgi:ribosomal protein S18 acetylase RimI-like enzyme
MKEDNRMFRAIVPEDTPILLELTASTQFFRPMEIDTLKEVLDDYHSMNQELGHRAFLLEQGKEVLGYVYHAPSPMTERSWYIYWIAVKPNQQGKGLGKKLLEYAEVDARDLNGRVMFIETSSLPHYDATRQFYLKCGYDQVAQVPDFYADGDNMVIFRKRL